MNDEVLVDTNVLVYSRDARDPAKQARAAEWLGVLWQRRAGRVSVQVLNEYYVTVTRKLHPGMARAAARTDIANLGAWRPVPLTMQVIERAQDLEDRYALSWWDSLVVASAHVGGCRWLLTEDLQDGQDLGGVTVVDPFCHRPEEVL